MKPSIVAILVQLFLFLSCHKDEPCVTCPPPKTDTTNHAFTWTQEYLGGAANSVLNDVAIINDTLAYAVGAIYLSDSSGNLDPNAYNMIRWNGSTWTLMRIQFLTICDQSSRSSYPASSILAFGETDVWISMDGDQVARWNGTMQISTMCLPVSFSIKKLGGARPTSLYAVGAGGNIEYYDGRSWQKIESGTAVDLTDIYGSPVGFLVWSCGYSFDKPGTFLYRMSGLTCRQAFDGTANEFAIKNDSLSGTITSVYAPTSSQLFVATTAGVYEVSSATRGEAIRHSFADTWFPGFPQEIRGSAANDWFVVGDYGFVAHYNGDSMHHFADLMNASVGLKAVAQRGNLAIAVGYSYDPIHSQALILIGRR